MVRTAGFSTRSKAERNHSLVLTNYENETFTRKPMYYLDGKSIVSGGREYDGHRQKVYDASRVVRGRGDLLKSLDEIRSYLDYLTDLKSYQRRFKIDSSDVKIRWKRDDARKSSARWRNKELAFSGKSVQEYVVLHELAHILAPPPHAGHGRLFSAVQLWLVGSRMKMKDKLLESYREHDVPYSPHHSIKV